VDLIRFLVICRRFNRSSVSWTV